MSSLVQVLGIGGILLLVGLMLFNGLVMLVSPRRWFDLPTYVALRGSMRRSMLASLGGRFQVRVLGLMLVAFVVYAVISFFAYPDGTGAGLPSQPARSGRLGVMYLLVCLVTCAGAFALGLVMLFNPSWCLDKWPPAPSEALPDVRAPLIRAIRILAVIPLAVGSYMGWSCIQSYWHP
jgi:hypothetical protein